MRAADYAFDPITALALSSALFGLAHVPYYGASGYIETAIGAHS